MNNFNKHGNIFYPCFLLTLLHVAHLWEAERGKSNTGPQIITHQVIKPTSKCYDIQINIRLGFLQLQWFGKSKNVKILSIGKDCIRKSMREMQRSFGSSSSRIICTVSFWSQRLFPPLKEHNIIYKHDVCLLLRVQGCH